MKKWNNIVLVKTFEDLHPIRKIPITGFALISIPLPFAFKDFIYVNTYDPKTTIGQFKCPGQ